MENQNIENERIQAKEQINTDQLKTLLTNWLDALNNEADFELEVNGETKRVPWKAWSAGRLNVEVEWKRGENEFEVELKWPGRPEDTLLKQ